MSYELDLCTPVTLNESGDEQRDPMRAKIVTVDDLPATIFTTKPYGEQSQLRFNKVLPGRISYLTKNMYENLAGKTVPVGEQMHHKFRYISRCSNVDSSTS